MEKKLNCEIEKKLFEFEDEKGKKTETEVYYVVIETPLGTMRYKMKTTENDKIVLDYLSEL